MCTLIIDTVKMEGWWNMLTLLLCTFTVVSGEYMFTFPRVMEAASTTKFCLELNDFDLDDLELQQDVTVDINLKFLPTHQADYEVKNYMFKSVAANFNGDFQICQELQAPDVGGKFSAVVNASVQYTADGNLREVALFGAEKIVKVTRPGLITLVQTDKPIYKPGQTVKFRVMTMDYNLLSRTDGYQQISIETPSKVRVMQWDDVPSPTGMVSLEMPLSADPVLGSWTIKVLYGSKEIVQKFKVDEYVLPKFEVTVTPPKYILPTTQDIHGTVCAKYTYGKPVKGDLKMRVCFAEGYYYRSRKTRPCAVIIDKIDGCYEFFIPANSIKLGHREYRSWGMLSIDANVTEDQTGIELLGSSQGPRLSFNPLNLRIEDDSNNYYKPLFPYNGRVVVTNPDGSAAPGEEILVTASSYESSDTWSRKFTTDDNGMVHFTLTNISSELGSLNLNADAVVYESDWRYTSDELFYRTYTPRGYARITKWFSPSNSYLYIPDVDSLVECNSELNLDVYYTAEFFADYKFTILVQAGDKIMYTDKKVIKADEGMYELDIVSVDESMVLLKQPPKPTTTFEPLPPLPPLPELPEPVPFEPVDEELIEPEVASITGGVRKKRGDFVPKRVGHFKLTVPVGQDMGPNAKVLVYYMRHIDKEVIASTVEFKVQNCFNNKVTMSFDDVKVKPGTDVNLNISASPSSNCFVGMVDKSVTLLGGNNQLTPKQLFNKVKQVSRPYHYIDYHSEDRDYCSRKTSSKDSEDYYYSFSTPDGVDAEQAFRDVNLWVETDALLKSRPCIEQRYMYYMRQGSFSGTSGPDEGLPGLPEPMMESLSATVDIEASAKQEDNDEPDVEQSIRTHFPETWLWDIIKIGEDGTLAFSTTIPDTITEWVGNTVCTHETDGVGVTELTSVTAFKPFFVSFTLPYSAIRGEVLPVIVTVFNYLSDCITLEVVFKKTEGFEFSDLRARSRQFCLCGGVSESTKFYIIPTLIGEIDLEVVAMSIEAADLCKDVVLGEIEIGVSDGVQRQLLIEAEGAPQEQTKSSFLCVKESEFITETVEMGLPKDLVQDSERATVSVVGDVMGPTLSNLKNLLRMPYGCGEQNMASWSPNIYVLQYLESTDQLTEELESQAEGYMQVGYQRQMKYRHNDNSYSAWGENKYGNATGSLWLTAFVVKSMAQSSAYIVVDKEDILRSARWLVSHQRDDGCFPSVGRVFSSYLKGGLNDDNPAGLSAFTLIALVQAELGEEFQDNITKGFYSCLDSFNLDKTDTYTLSLMLYAYTIFEIDGPRRTQVLNELNERRISKDGLTHWRRVQEKEPETDGWYWYRAQSAEVEMTSYVLLSMLSQGADVIGDVQPIVQWLTKQRNPYGGFSSTQDTVVALQALAEFGKLTYNGETSVTVQVKNKNIDHVFSIKPMNSLVYQSVDIDPNHGPVEIEVIGTGCALVQVNMMYNIYTEDDGAPAFNVKVVPYRSRKQSRNCAIKTVEVCTSYQKGGISNMAIAEVKMPTGWVQVSSTLDELLKSGKIQKYEVDKNYVELYFDELSSSTTCVDFDVEQEIRLDSKPALVRVYDYYETSYSVTQNYSLKTICGTKEEIPLDNEGLDCSIMQCRVDTSKLIKTTCPDCLQSVDNETLGKLLCNAEKVYKSIVRRKGDYSIKLKADLRVKGKTIVDKFVNYKMADRCVCPNLEEGSENRAFIFAKSSAYLPSTEELWLQESETVIPYKTAYERIINKLSSKKNACAKIERLKRSTSVESFAKLLRIKRKFGLV